MRWWWTLTAHTAVNVPFQTYKLFAMLDGTAIEAVLRFQLLVALNCGE